MSFHRAANRLLLLAVPALIAVGMIGGMTPVLGAILGHPAVIGSLWLLLAFSAGGGFALPVISALLDRRRPGSEPQGARVRVAALVVAIVSAAAGALIVIAGDGAWRLAGLALAGTAIAAGILVSRHHPASAAPGSPGFGATYLGAILLLLALSALPSFTDTKERAYSNAMRSDLRTLATAQEVFRDSAGHFSDDPAVDGRFEATRGVVIRLGLTPDGWNAIATHELIDGRCAIFEGSSPAAPATESLVPSCDVEPTNALAMIGAGIALTILASGAILYLAGRIHERRTLADTVDRESQVITNG